MNRIWKQLMGRGFVEPVDDWEASKPTHPELLEWLAREFVAHNYDMKHLQRLIEQLFLRLLTRRPTSEERSTFAKMLSPGFAERIIPEGQRPPPIVRPPLKYVAWSNHLSAGANSIKIEMEKRAREGGSPTTALRPPP
jgi:hypothetical protein